MNFCLSELKPFSSLKEKINILVLRRDTGHCWIIDCSSTEQDSHSENNNLHLEEIYAKCCFREEANIVNMFYFFLKKKRKELFLYIRKTRRQILHVQTLNIHHHHYKQTQTKITIVIEILLQLIHTLIYMNDNALQCLYATSAIAGKKSIGAGMESALLSPHEKVLSTGLLMSRMTHRLGKGSWTENCITFKGKVIFNKNLMK